MSWRRLADIDTEDTQDEKRAKQIAGGLYNQFNEFHLLDFRPHNDVEIQLLEQQLACMKAPKPYVNIPKGTIIFNPSGASKCPRELYYQFKRELKDQQLMYPYQKRWTRNSTAVHGAVQKDFLYMEKLMDNPKFKMAKDDQGRPMWEENVKALKLFEHDGVQFGMSGMMDGVLNYVPDNSNIGFEFKTKTNSVAQVGTYKMKDAADSHKLQCVAYSHMFNLDEFILMYEAVSKDQWNKGAEAKMDIRTFYYKPTEEEKVALLDKFATVVKAVKTDNIPEKDTTKCLFCNYKDLCGGV